MITEILVGGEWVTGTPTMTGDRFRQKFPSGTTVDPNTGDDVPQYAVVEQVYSVEIPSQRVTRLAFLDRFTEDEYVGLDMASIDDPAATTAARIGAAKIRRYLEKVKSATYIDLSRPDTIAGVQALAVVGLLTSERADEILEAPITETERYSGAE